MARVRMLMDVSGLRGSGGETLGVPWPQHGEILETGDDEAEALVRNGMAVAVAERPARPEPPKGEDAPATSGTPQKRTAPPAKKTAAK